MNSKKLIVVLNQDRYRYYAYHQVTSLNDKILCFYDQTGRLPDNSDIASNVTIIKKDSELTFEYIIDELEKYVSDCSEIAVVCTEEKYFVLAGQLREHLNLCTYGPGLETSVFFRDKVVMKQKVENWGFAVPKHAVISHSTSYQDLSRLLDTDTFIVKPIDGHGARKTYLVHNEAEFIECDIDCSGMFEAEKYIDGTLYHIDSIIEGGKIIYSKPFEYSFPCYEYKNGKVISSLELTEASPLYNKLTQYNEALLSHLSGNHVIHLELFIDGEDIIFLEIAGRPPGGGLVPLHRIAHGVDFAQEAMKIQMLNGYKPRSVGKREKYCTFFMVPSPKLTCVTKIDTPTFQSDVEFFYNNVNVGDELNVSESVSQNAAFYLVSSKEKSHIEADFQMFKNHIMFT
ncbi:conserved hypothetical protein [Vibrio nigripulchritudo SOn1]|uniref:ATP-grasp domain-containing protein n=1 Tax=Vibrio nigripulchritudo SOn1 TaxID=1238450 RepID=A0AAV2VJZ4_9VIBR|nr:MULTISPECIES: hypothetical protein [Vibrio]UAB73912.1 hypothetical protein INR79_22490 [Vibrio sp. SCSIO 43132]CCO45002.1 conserved hypothetical protein [Vibrio nigripulchritudo SOn1]